MTETHGSAKNATRSRARLAAAAAIGALALALTGLAGCGLFGGRDQADTVKLMIISPHWRGITTEFGRGFAEWMQAEHSDWLEQNGYTRVVVEWPDLGGTGDNMQYLRAEFARRPQGIGIDLFFGGGVDPYIQLKREGLLARHEPPTEIIDAIPAEMGGMPVYDPDGYWFGAVFTGFGIIYNKQILDKLGVDPPGVWADLADPRLFNEVSSVDPRHSGSFHMMYELILQSYGWEQGWETLHGIAGNTQVFRQSSSQAPTDVADGEDAAALSIDFFAFAQIELAGPGVAGFVIPEGISVVNPDAIAILKGAPNRELAELFIQFVLSEPGQMLWMARKGVKDGPEAESLNRMSILPELYDKLGPDQTNVTLNPYQWRLGLEYDPDLGSRRYQALNDLMGALLIDTHQELKAAWKRVRHDPALVSRLAELPITEQQALELEESEAWNDPASRQAIINQWVEFARTKYAGL